MVIEAVPVAGVTDQPPNAQDNVSLETICAELQSIDEMLDQHLAMQKESQKQAATNVIDEKWLEEQIALAVDKAFEANSEALLARFQEENDKNEKVMKECMNEIKEMTTGLLNKAQSMAEKTAEEVTDTILTTIEEILYSSLMEAFQEWDIKWRIKLEKSISAKLKATVARQIQAQFQTLGKQSLEEEDVPEIDQETSRLAAVNLDWHHRSDYDSDSQEHDEGGSLDESENGDENDTEKEDDSVVELNDEDEDAMFLLASKVAIKRAMKVFEMGTISQASAPSSSSPSPFGPSDSINEQESNNLSLETKTKELLLDLLCHKGPQSGFREKASAPSSSSPSPFGPSDSINEQESNNLSLETKTKELLLDLLCHKGPQSGFREKASAPSSSSPSPFGPSDSINEQESNNLSLETKTKELLLDLLTYKPKMK